MRATIMTTPTLWARGRCVECYPKVYENMIHLFPVVLAAEMHREQYQQLEEDLKRDSDRKDEAMRAFISRLGV